MYWNIKYQNTMQSTNAINKRVEEQLIRYMDVHFAAKNIVQLLTMRLLIIQNYIQQRIFKFKSTILICFLKFWQKVINFDDKTTKYPTISPSKYPTQYPTNYPSKYPSNYP
eukprot:153869_1